MQAFKELFGRLQGVVIGMIHVRALPGTPQSRHTVQQLVELACQEAAMFKRTGVDAVLIENMHDVPYVQGHEMGPEITAVMTRVCSEVKKVISNMPCGVQILASANKQAIAVALATGCQFVRVEGYVFSHVADEGITNACAGSLCRYRKSIGAEHVKIFADIKKKHCSHSITADVDLATTAKAAEFFLSDGLIVTGQATAHPPQQFEVKNVAEAVKLPVLVGSGVTKNNLQNYFKTANGFIVGSHFKKNQKWDGDLEETHISEFVNQVRLFQTGQLL